MKNSFLKIIIPLLICLISSSADATVKGYFITCNPDDFKAIYKNPWPDTYIPVTLTYNGRTWENVTLRIRGDDTRGHPKKSLKIKFEGDAFENGRDVLNFNAEYEDPTYICQYLASLTFRHIGYPCFEAEHARLYLNGKFLGLYLQIENVDDKFLESRGLDPTGNLYKATEDDASLSIYDDITKLWEKKTNESGSWNDLQQLIDSLFYVPDNEYYYFSKRTFDYERMIDIFALNILLANGSTYYHNYFMYHDFYFSNKWMMFPWDMDKTFSMYGYYYPYHRSSSYTSPDNPYYERALLCEPIFNDIRGRITQFKNQFFNNQFFDPIIDSLANELKESVAEDTTDNITDTTKWLGNIEGTKKYISERYKILQIQFDYWPRSFKVEPTMGYYSDSVKFVWHPSFHASNKEITYDFYFGTKELLDDTNTTTIIKGITDTVYVKKDLPADGTYWWKVAAFDGNEYVDGFNYPNPIKIKKAVTLDCEINVETRLSKENSPYNLNCNMTINSNLILEKGVTLLIDNGKKITINGSLIINGTREEPVRIEPSFYGNQIDKIELSGGNLTAKNAIIQDCIIEGMNVEIDLDSVEMIRKYKDLTSIKTYFYIIGGTVSFKNSSMTIDSSSEALVFKDLSSAIVENCTVKNAFDAIEYISINNGIITNCTVFNAHDDAIDINNCDNNVISFNRIFNSSDKGISVGNEEIGASSNTLIKNNIIVNCKIGIAIKDSSNALVQNNTLYDNETGINIYEKFPGLGGGKAEIENTIIAKSSYPLKADNLSEVSINYSLSTDSVLKGVGNLKADPMFVDPENFNFRLLAGSPCIDAGNPNGPNDPDGTRADIGALAFGDAPDLPKIIINEINYNSSTDFNSGDWVEFYNADSKDINLSGWIFMDSDNTHKFIFPDDFILGKGEYVVLCRQMTNFSALFPTVNNTLGDFSFGLSSTGELLRLYDNNLSLIDSVIYGVSNPWPSEPNGKGKTLELISPELDNAIPQSWTASENNGSPGRKNGTDTLIPFDSKIISFKCVPNPFDEGATLVINSPKRIFLSISIHNLYGEIINEVFKGNIEKGVNEIPFRLGNIASGIYYCRIISNEFERTVVLSHIK